MSNNNNQNQERSTPNTQQVFGAPKSSKKMLLTILGAVGLVVLVAAGTITYLLLNIRTSEPLAKSGITALPALGDSLKSSLEDSNNASVLIYKSSNPATVIYKIDDNNWITAEDGSTVLTFSSIRNAAASNKSDYNSVTERLKSEGFTEVETSTGVSSSYNSAKATAQYFSSEDIACSLRNTPETKHYSLQVDCSDKADFSKNSEAVKPFAEAYASNKENGDKDILFAKPDIQNSVTENYKNARLSVFGLDNLGNSSTAEFYQTPDGNWHFFTASEKQGKINCSDYDTDELKNAYLGFSCWNALTKKSSFVQKPNPTFEIVPGASGE